ATRLHQHARIQKGEEIDDAGLLRQALTEESRGARADLRRQGVEDAQRAQRKASVAEVGAALAAGETAVGVLRGEQEAGVPGAHRLREAGQSVGKLSIQVLEVTHRKWTLTVSDHRRSDPLRLPKKPQAALIYPSSLPSPSASAPPDHFGKQNDCPR